MTAAAIFVTGRDPELDQVCSHTSYVRTHARAALRAGYDAHLVCLARETRVQPTDYGVVHAAATTATSVRQNGIPFLSAPLAQKTAEVAAGLAGRPMLLHGFGVWGHAVERARALLAPGGLAPPSLLGSYTTYLDESQSQWRGLSGADGIGAYARFAAEQAWIRALVFRYERQAYRGADRVLTNYRAVEKLIVARFGEGVRRQVIPYSIEQEFLGVRPGPRPPETPGGPDGPSILCIARHDPRKGIDVLLHALRRLRDAGVRLRAKFAGDGVLLEAHRRLAAALGLGGCVEILGRVPDVDPMLADADLFVLPSREEQSGSLALIEAMRAGVPCVASACDGIPEDVRHEQDAWLTAPGDAASLADGIGALIARPDLRAELASAGRRVFETRFSAEGLARALDGVYRDVLAGARAAA